MTVLQFPELSNKTSLPLSDHPARLRVMAPLKRESDIFKVLPYLQALAIKARIEVLFLHVTDSRVVAHRLQVEALLATAATACIELGLAHQTVVADGDVAFAILDNAESLDCDQIVVARPVASAWRTLFVTPVVRQLESLGRDVPLVLVNFAGTAQENAR